MIYQTIPQRHIHAFLEKGHYFTPCCDFDDKVEFRYGYCLFNYHFSSAKGLAKCVGYTHEDAEVNRWINSSGVSCWVRELYDEPRMWKVHGSAGAAIRISVRGDSLLRHVEAQKHATASGAVIYGGVFSSVEPQFSVRWKLEEAEDAIHHLFFHKRPKYGWEREFRIVLFSKRGVYIKMAPEMIDSVEISPLGELDSSLKRKLRDVFGNHILESADDRNALRLQRIATQIDDGKASPQVARLNKKLAKLEARSYASGMSWNDPKISDAQMKQSIELAKQIFEVREQIRQATPKRQSRH